MLGEVRLSQVRWGRSGSVRLGWSRLAQFCFGQAWSCMEDLVRQVGVLFGKVG